MIAQVFFRISSFGFRVSRRSRAAVLEQPSPRRVKRQALGRRNIALLQSSELNHHGNGVSVTGPFARHNRTTASRSPRVCPWRRSWRRSWRPSGSRSPSPATSNSKPGENAITMTWFWRWPWRSGQGAVRAGTPPRSTSRRSGGGRPTARGRSGVKRLIPHARRKARSTGFQNESLRTCFWPARRLKSHPTLPTSAVLPGDRVPELEPCNP